MDRARPAGQQNIATLFDPQVFLLFLQCFQGATIIDFLQMNTTFDFQCLLRDIKGAEGPLTTPAGDIFMVSPGHGEILRLRTNGERTVHANTGGKPAGLQLHADGSIWVSDMVKGILKVTPDGEVKPVVTEFEGQPIRGCNDLAFDSQGNLYFTAPAGSSGKPDGAVGEVFYRSLSGEVKRIGNGYAFPNGITINPAENLLIFAETFTHKLWAAELSAPGEVQKWRVWAALPHEPEEKAGGDGMDFDANGHLVATNYSRGALEIYDAAGKHLRSIPLPFKCCSNVHFFPGDDKRLLVTEHENHALWVFNYGCGGHPQFGWNQLLR